MDVLTYDCLVVGTGAAGYNATCRLKQFGKKVALVTEDIACGTSRNAGSDKQTYYKLGLGDTPDSVRQMAEDLFAGGSVDGDNALCEAALSARCFLHLCELGVAFPHNRYGEYVGYKTDHDPFSRATSAGPLTSKDMTEALEREADRLGVEIFDGYTAIEILKSGDGVCGLLCIKKDGELTAFHCGDIVLCTGGPAGIYADSVYPLGHTGSTGLALLAGATAQNLTEWQFGLSSVEPRWNVSGTYMQVLPCFVSVDENGTEYDFLKDAFHDIYEAMSAVFLKGYQWPFDSRKVMNGSSVIDLLVYRERVMRKRRVFLDFTRNPFGLDTINFSALSREAYTYLHKAGACNGRPIDRLEKMNAPAIALYRSKGVDLTKERLEIALCAQHHNGGIAVDMWWQTSVRGLFAAGECAGTHGVARPGGSALNAGQVGALRAAQYICRNPHTATDEYHFSVLLAEAESRYRIAIEQALRLPDNVDALTEIARQRMSDFAGAIRNEADLQTVLMQTRQELDTLSQTAGINNVARFRLYCKLRDTLVTQMAVIRAMLHYAKTAGGTRGSALYYDSNGLLREGLDERFRFLEDNGITNDKTQETHWDGTDFVCRWRAVRPIPQEDDFFENVWKSFRQNRNIY